MIVEDVSMEWAAVDFTHCLLLDAVDWTHDATYDCASEGSLSLCHIRLIQM